MKHQVTYGSDVGSSNWGFAGTRSRGLLRLRREDGSVMYEGALPDIEVLRLERWDLKQGQVLTHDAHWNPVLLQLEGVPPGKSEHMLDWGRALAKALARCPELFEADAETGALPVFVTENQCDMVKTGFQKMEMFRLVDQFTTQLDFLDQEKQLRGRVHRLANCKYMMRNDHSLETRLDRKKESHQLGLQLLADLGLAGPLRYLQKLEARGEQIHDMTDALLLAVQDQLDCAEAEARAQIRELQALIKSIPRKPTVKRVKKNLLVAVPQAEAKLNEIDLVEDSSGETTEEAAPAPKKRAPKKSKESAEPKEKRKRAPKKTNASPVDPEPKEKRKRAPAKAPKAAAQDETESKKRAKTDSGPVLLAEEFFATAEENCK